MQWIAVGASHGRNEKRDIVGTLSWCSSTDYVIRISLSADPDGRIGLFELFGPRKEFLGWYHTWNQAAESAASRVEARANTYLESLPGLAKGTWIFRNGDWKASMYEPEFRSGGWVSTGDAVTIRPPMLAYKALEKLVVPHSACFQLQEDHPA